MSKAKTQLFPPIEHNLICTQHLEYWDLIANLYYGKQNKKIVLLDAAHDLGESFLGGQIIPQERA